MDFVLHVAPPDRPDHTTARMVAERYELLVVDSGIEARADGKRCVYPFSAVRQWWLQ